MKNYQIIINKINELYITERQKYLILSKSGDYNSLTKGKNSPMALCDNLIKQHLEGKHTVGVFSGSQFSKFICFDVDMIDSTQTRWISINIINSLKDLGFDDSDIHISTSGNKGVHVLIFSNHAIQLSYFKKLFVLAMKNLQSYLSVDSNLYEGNELILEIKDVCNIEFRPNFTQAVKIELGHNFKNKSINNQCLFLDKITFNPIKDFQYFLEIQATESEIIKSIIENNGIIESGVALVKNNIKESHAHKINRDETETIDFIKDLLINGMTTIGSRNNSIFKLARYFSYMGLDLDEAIYELKEWMLRQNKKYYKSPLEFCLVECERIARSVYEKGYTLVGEIENLKLYKDEMIEVMKIKEKNTKLILFSMILHSKRFTNKNGTFYMTYTQIYEMCGLGYKSAFNNISILEDLNLIEVVDRNVKQKGSYIKKPNKYRVNITSNEDENVLEIDNSNNNLDYFDLYYKSVTSLFTDKELRQSNVPDRQYREFKKYRKLSA